MSEFLRREAEWKKAGFPKRHSTAPAMFRDIETPKPALTKALASMAPGSWVALAGPRGTGKTQLATRLAHAAFCRGEAVRYTTAMEMFRTVKSTFDGGNESEAIRRFTAPDLLVIDEIQVRFDTQFERNLLTEIADARYRDCKSLILISNLVPDAFLDILGDSVASRLREVGFIAECNWPSYR